jgi:hypothetical protein
LIFKVDLEGMAEEHVGRFMEKSLSRQLGNRVDGYLSSLCIALTVPVGLREGDLFDFEVLECKAGIPIG